MRVALITVPYIKNEVHYNLARSTYDSILGGNLTNIELYKIAVINHCEENYKSVVVDSNDLVLYNDTNNLAKAWNIGIEEARKIGIEHFFIPNLDVILHKDALYNLSTYASNNKGLCAMQAVPTMVYLKMGQFVDNAKIVNHDHAFSAFMIDSETIDKVGYFYVGFEPCYFEDDDYQYRLKLADMVGMRVGKALFYHFSMQSIQNSKEDQDSFNTYFYKNRDLYIKRWGGLPELETYTKPAIL